MRALLEGGVIADGVRPAETEADHLMAEALYYESAARLWGFPPDVVERQRFGLVGRMMEVAAIRAEVEERKMNAAGGAS